MSLQFLQIYNWPITPIVFLQEISCSEIASPDFPEPMKLLSFSAFLKFPYRPASSVLESYEYFADFFPDLVP